MWQVAAEYEVDDSRLINVEMAIDALESSEEPLSETEQKLLSLYAKRQKYRNLVTSLSSLMCMASREG